MKRKTFAIAFVILAALLAVYLCMALFFKSHFFFGSTVNETIPSSGATAEAVKQALLDQADGYALTIQEREGKSETISSADAGLSLDLSKGQVEGLLKSQNVFTWPVSIFKDVDYESETLSQPDPGKLSAAVNSLSCVTNPSPTETEDATYVYADGKYSVKEEIYGTRVDADKLYSAAEEAMENLQDSIDLDADKIYIQPARTKDDPDLISLVDELNQKMSMQISYDTGDTIDADTLASFFSVDDDLKLSVNEEAVEAFVNAFAKKYNTAGLSKELVTSYGSTVTVPGGNYGWLLNKSEETKELVSELEEGKSVSRSPVWKLTAASHGDHDYGNSYVEVNLTAQHLFLYINGQRVLDSPVVTGNVSKEWSTPAGAYAITYLDKDTMLNGESHVNYWMPFNGNIGLHDASWRSHFGGADYLTKGSHGCVNLPMNISPEIYKQVSAGFPVLLYTLPGTESYDAAAATNTVNLINAIGTVTAQSGKAIESARAAYNALDANTRPAVTNAKKLTAAESAYAAIPKTTTVAEAPGQ